MDFLSHSGYGRGAYVYTLTKGSDNISYLYDANDLRMYKRVITPAQTTEEMYLKDALGRDLVIVNLSAASPSYEYFAFGTERFARITSLPAGATPEKILPNEATFFLYDHLGNTRVSYQATGNSPATAQVVFAADYYPYGKTLRAYTSGNGDRYQSTMHERDDETELDYRGARYYDSDLGRFLSLDPLAAKYPALSAYSYVAGNPILFIDADGKEIVFPVNMMKETAAAFQQLMTDLGATRKMRRGIVISDDG